MMPRASFWMVALMAGGASVALGVRTHSDQAAMQQELLALGLGQRASLPATVMVVEQFIASHSLTDNQSNALRELERAHRARVERGQAKGTDPAQLHGLFLRDVDGLLGPDMARAFGAQGNWQQGHSPGLKN